MNMRGENGENQARKDGMQKYGSCSCELTDVGGGRKKRLDEKCESKCVFKDVKSSQSAVYWTLKHLFV